MTRARITGVGAYAPKRVLTNAELEKMVATSDEWIVQRTGIRQRHIADESEATSDLAVKAAQQALERANLVPEDIEFIVVGTTTPDMIFPSVGNIVQHRLGCRRAGSVDLMAACAGSVYSMVTGAQFIQTGKYKRVLCIGAETLSKITDFTDRGTCILLADAAGAAVLEATEEDRGILDVDLYSDGQYWELLYMPGGGSRHPATAETNEYPVEARVCAACASSHERNSDTFRDVPVFGHRKYQASLRVIGSENGAIRRPLARSSCTKALRAIATPQPCAAASSASAYESKLGPRSVAILLAPAAASHSGQSSSAPYTCSSG